MASDQSLAERTSKAIGPSRTRFPFGLFAVVVGAQALHVVAVVAAAL
jgi:hypothetical protein